MNNIKIYYHYILTESIIQKNRFKVLVCLWLVYVLYVSSITQNHKRAMHLTVKNLRF